MIGKKRILSQKIWNVTAGDEDVGKQRFNLSRTSVNFVMLHQEFYSFAGTRTSGGFIGWYSWCAI